jgi:hypothetical protein
MLIAGMLFACWQGREDATIMQNAIEAHLGLVLGELESRQEGGRFPSVQAARKAMNDETVARRVQITSLFDTGDLFYNPAQPLVGGEALVLCARVPNHALVAIQADRKVRVLGETEFEKAGFLPLADAPTENKAEPAGPANGRQPIRAETKN